MRITSRCAGMAAAAVAAGMFMLSGAEGATAKVTIVGAGKGAGAFRIAGA
ncbi:MAG: hypothetical protein HY535_01155, partial [Chloroflexi bacterium]|nr:hypothetical protein [Chloroflexota bacterium]